MNKKILFSIIIIIIILSLTIVLYINRLSLFNIGNKDKITVQGIIKLVGSEPFTKLIIQTSDGNKYYLPDSLKNDTELFYKKVTLQGILKKKILKTADGKHKLEQLHLEDVKIISKE